MKKIFTTAVMVGALSLGLTACNDDDQAEKQEPAKKVEQAAPAKEVAPAKEAATSSSDNRDMTPAEALDNMKRDAGIVADKAVEAYDAAKEALTKE